MHFSVPTFYHVFLRTTCLLKEPVQGSIYGLFSITVFQNLFLESTLDGIHSKNSKNYTIVM